MAMVCVNGSSECTGCMQCEEEKEYYCPVCGEKLEWDEQVYVVNGNEIIGCENCIETMSADEYEDWE